MQVSLEMLAKMLDAGYTKAEIEKYLTNEPEKKEAEKKEPEKKEPEKKNDIDTLVDAIVAKMQLMETHRDNGKKDEPQERTPEDILSEILMPPQKEGK